jgi:hypothetical protein
MKFNDYYFKRIIYFHFFIAFIVKLLFFYFGSDEWNDLSNIRANEIIFKNDFFSIAELLFSSLLSVSTIILSISFANKIIKSSPITKGKNRRSNFFGSYIPFFVLLFSFFLASTFKIYNVGLDAEKLPLKLYGQLRILCISIPVFYITKYLSYTRGLFLVILFSISLIVLSGSKAAFILPILYYFLLNFNLKNIKYLLSFVVLFYTVVNPYAFRVNLGTDQIGALVDFRDYLDFILTKEFNLDRLFLSFYIIVDRIPGIDVFVNSRISELSFNFFNNAYYNSLIGNSTENASFATSFVGNNYIMLGPFGFVITGLVVFVIFLLRNAIEATFRSNLLPLARINFYIYFLFFLIDGNTHLFFSYMSMFYLYVVILIQKFMFFPKKTIEIKEKNVVL